MTVGRVVASLLVTGLVQTRPEAAPRGSSCPLGVVLVLGLGVGLAVTYRSGVAWALAAVVVVVALVAGLCPLFATASSAVEQGRELVPWVTGLVRALRG